MPSKKKTHRNTEVDRSQNRRRSPEGAQSSIQIPNSALLSGQFEFSNELEQTEDDEDDDLRNVASRYIESDGRKYDNAGDAPGQSVSYILSGNHWGEEYRLATFASFPPGIPISPSDLAFAGFYFTGYKDRVKCFSCGIVVENWMDGDDGRDSRWHKRDCDMRNGRDETNVPRGAFNFRNLLNELKNTSNQTGQSASSSSQMNMNETRRAATQHTASLIGSPAGLPVADELVGRAAGYAPMKIAAAPITRFQIAQQPQQQQQQEFEELRLGEIHSEEHEYLIFSLDLRKEEHRRKTFAKWPSFPAPELPAKLAREGFFYLGNLDRTQCFSCSGILRNWTRNDEPRREHRKHFPDCKIISGLETRDIPMNPDERQRLDFEEQLRINSLSTLPDEPADPSTAEKQHLAKYFKCQNPVNPYMANVNDRISSFNANWPSQRIKASTRSIAEAGFFYLGQGDRTKCFYCNGGLQNWDEFDEPWIEHAKWFPGCEFVLRRKGTDLVKRMLDEHPNIQRPTIRNHCSYNIPPMSPRESIGIGEELLQESANGINHERREPAEVLQDLQTERSCKVCYMHESDHLCMPCSHLSLCSNCAKTTKKCPTCHRMIDSKLKIYRN